VVDLDRVLVGELERVDDRVDLVVVFGRSALSDVFVVVFRVVGRVV
tara:strand:- start:157 stop:294 length:138 start_codon:yes stop_codon:yes gene_type:complete